MRENWALQWKWEDSILMMNCCYMSAGYLGALHMYRNVTKIPPQPVFGFATKLVAFCFLVNNSTFFVIFTKCCTPSIWRHRRHGFVFSTIFFAEGKEKQQEKKNNWNPKPNQMKRRKKKTIPKWKCANVTDILNNSS